MNQTLSLTPFDLLARRWHRPAPVIGAVFEESGKAMAFRDADGGLALAPLADAEDTPARLRLELQTGRTVIRPRKADPAPLTDPGLVATAAVALPDLGFLAADPEGGLHRLTPRGQAARLTFAGGAVAALACDGEARLAVAREAGVEILGSDLRLLGRVAADGACGLAFRAGLLAVAHRDGLILRDGDAQRRIAIVAPAGTPVFDVAARWLAGPSVRGGLWLAEIGSARTAHLADFPLPPASVAFDAGGQRLVASGAYRLVAWTLDRPPFDGDTAGALRSGRTCPVAVTAAAPHPRRDVVAVGRANGELAFARLGQPEEMVLRPADGDAIRMLVWSPDGRHLAMGTQEGTAALVDVPAQIFK